jgi:DNA-directed RNA polymerase specialized sigma subunit
MENVSDEYRKKLNKAWTEEEVEKEVNTDLEIQWQQFKTDSKNTATDTRNGLIRSADNCYSKRLRHTSII